jgi:glycosyltransferase involved in cell wall biosynthesis
MADSMSTENRASDGAERIRVLTFSSLFPSTARPRHGIFVETRVRHLVHDCGVDARVIAPVPWFPSGAAVFGAYAAMARTPRHALRDGGLPVSYPRYPMLPRIGVGFQPDGMALAAARDVANLKRTGWSPDLIDAHYFYPDGVAAALLARRLGLPLVITARGTDINVLGRMPGPARRIVWAAERASAVIAVSTRLKDALVAMGVSPSKVSVLRNGVDTDVFRPEDRAAARQRLRLPAGALLACVGNLAPEKGHALAIESLPQLPDCHLVLVGEGPLRADLAALAQRLGVAGRVLFLPNMPQSDLRGVYSAADALLLPSLREGWPNVVLEAFACGTPVVATDAGAVAEMITAGHLGRIVADRQPGAYAAAIRALLAAAPDREAIRAHAARFDWTSISRAQLALFRHALAGHRAAA